MFSRFLAGKDEKVLEALEMQWRMEFAKAKRKFLVKKEKEKERKQKKGRRPLGELKLNAMMNYAEKALDLTKIAREVATTREGRRNHSRAAKIVEETKKEVPSKNKTVRLILLVLNYY